MSLEGRYCVPTLLQVQQWVSDRIEATESPDGVELHKQVLPDHNADGAWQHCCTLTLEGWRTLAEMYILRHPMAAKRIFENWKAILPLAEAEANRAAGDPVWTGNPEQPGRLAGGQQA